MTFFLLNDIFIWNLTYAQFLFYSANALAYGISFLIAIVLYITCRPLFPALVNCWFCNRNFLVPYRERNCFDCRYCDQYNGFTSDGNYNKDVCMPSKNQPTAPSPKTARTNGLCNTCNNNQQLKVQQLAAFTPMNDDDYNVEIEHYKDQLEKAYQLCDKCALVLTQTLQTQHYELLTERLNKYCPSGRAEIETSPNRRGISALNGLSLGVLIIMTTISISDGLIQLEYLETMPFAIEMLTEHMVLSSTVGILSLVISLMLKRQLGRRECLLLATWACIVTASLHGETSLVLLPAVTCFLCYCLPRFFSTKQVKLTPLLKCSKPEVSSTQAVLKGKEDITTGVTACKEETKSPVLEQKKPENTPRKIDTGSQTPRKIETRSQTAKKLKNAVQRQESDLSRKEENVRSRCFSPPPEVYNGLNSLRLGSPEPESKKPSNYLFEKVNFSSDKLPRNPIRPAKFYPNSSSPMRQDSPRKISSTPLNDKNFSDIPSSLTPLSPYGLYSPSIPCEYDFHSNMAYCPPIGHSAVYTYARPASCPAFSPPFFTTYNYPMSPTPSEAYSTSHSCSSFSTVQESKTWTCFKTALSILGYCLNAIGLFYLASTFWQGSISLF